MAGSLVPLGSSNAFSHLPSSVQFGQYGAALTMESLGRRWRWEKAKAWRFFRKHADAFLLIKLAGAFGGLICNAVYPTGEQISLPSQDKFERILREIRTKDANAHRKQASDHLALNMPGYRCRPHSLQTAPLEPQRGLFVASYY